MIARLAIGPSTRVQVCRPKKSRRRCLTCYLVLSVVGDVHLLLLVRDPLVLLLLEVLAGNAFVGSGLALAARLLMMVLHAALLAQGGRGRGYRALRALATALGLRFVAG